MIKWEKVDGGYQATHNGERLYIRKSQLGFMFSGIDFTGENALQAARDYANHKHS